VRTIALALLGLTLATAASASSAQEVTVLPRPAFPPPATEVEPPGARLELVASRFHSPADLVPPLREPPSFVPKRFRGAELNFAIFQRGGHIFLVYGGRYLVKASSPRNALDFRHFSRPPNGGYGLEIRWAREAGGVLYVSHAHPTYASATKGRNAYLSAIDVERGKTLWRSPALVANTRNFYVDGNLIVSGYGFTAEPDFLYLLDRRTGKVLDRLAVPSAPEVIKSRGDRIHVRTYDRDVVVRIAR
jgi:hypothetical protein